MLRMCRQVPCIANLPTTRCPKKMSVGLSSGRIFLGGVIHQHLVMVHWRVQTGPRRASFEGGIRHDQHQAISRSSTTSSSSMATAILETRLDLERMFFRVIYSPGGPAERMSTTTGVEMECKHSPGEPPTHSHL